MQRRAGAGAIDGDVSRWFRRQDGAVGRPRLDDGGRIVPDQGFPGHLPPGPAGGGIHQETLFDLVIEYFTLNPEAVDPSKWPRARTGGSCRVG
jgi:hypothetical protein